MWSDTQRYGQRGTSSLGSNTLTFVIVGVVVLINSVAWEIPLPTGTERPTPTETVARLNDPVSATNGTIPHPTPRPAGLSAGQSSVPLPEMAPSGSRLAGHLAPSELQENTTRRPKTRYPHPERAPELLLLPVNNSEPAEVTTDDKSVLVRSNGYRAPDLAMVSPYAPGYRMLRPPATERSNSPAPYALQDLDKETTLERAREIAQRASRRFAEMRARLEPRDQSRPQTTGNALLSLDARRPTASLIGSSSTTKNAVAEVPPELIRSPLLPSVTITGDDDVPADTTVPSAVVRKPNRTPEVAQPVRIASVPIPAANSRPSPSIEGVTAQDDASVEASVYRAPMVSQADEAVDKENTTQSAPTPRTTRAHVLAPSGLDALHSASREMPDNAPATGEPNAGGRRRSTAFETTSIASWSGQISLAACAENILRLGVRGVHTTQD